MVVCVCVCIAFISTFIIFTFFPLHFLSVLLSADSFTVECLTFEYHWLHYMRLIVDDARKFARLCTDRVRIDKVHLCACSLVERQLRFICTHALNFWPFVFSLARE